ncbi:GntR family transcriptional regulator [Actinacidiphila sp. bgisy144]|uniref:GntR family transcriptional regulator n=1 Tax=unclassified Actinacidiphila TaxID=2995708 RepID=UPI003EBE3C7D
MDNPRPGASPSAAERAYADTKERILAGDLPGGSLISEVEVADRIGLSRTPVRAAFLRLEGEELLRLIPKRGAVVVPVPPHEAANVLEVREALECAAVRRLLAADDGALADAVGRLRGCLAEQAAPARDLDVDTFTRLDQAFHLAIVAASGNTLAERFYASLGDRQRRMAVHALRPRPDRLSVLAREHEALVGHIAARDESAFAAALRRHLDDTHRALDGTGR